MAILRASEQVASHQTPEAAHLLCKLELLLSKLLKVNNLQLGRYDIQVKGSVNSLLSSFLGRRGHCGWSYIHFRRTIHGDAGFWGM